jgi:class 3 adenylate cyclase
LREIGLNGTTALKTLFDYLLAVPDGLSSEEARQYIFFKIGYPNGASIHLLYCIIFAMNGVAFLAWYNLVVTGLFTLGALTWSRFRNPLWLFVLLWIIEIPLHALLGTLATGIQTMFWIVPISSAVLSLIIPSFSWPVRIVLASILTIYVGFLFSLDFITEPASPLTTSSEVALFLSNYVVLGAIIMYVGSAQRLVQIAEARQQEEFDRAEDLLLNILPVTIVQRLKDGETVIADDHKEVSVVFADIVDFTDASSRLTPAEVVQTLNTVFSEFDAISDRYGAEKIKTIGDAYMVVVGAPKGRRNHPEVAVDLALAMQKAAASLGGKTHFDVKLRIGVNSGPAVAGVIGQRKFVYDLWGDAVNVASRMDSLSEPGMILITDATANLLSQRFKVIPQGVRDVKGKGSMPVFSVEYATGGR